MTDVVVPTVVKCDPAVARTSRSETISVITRAATQALLQSQSALADRAESVAGVAIEPPTVRWAGDVTALDEALKTQLAGDVLGALGSAIMDANLTALVSVTAAEPQSRFGLITFGTLDEAYDAVVRAFGHPSPRDGVLFATYGIWHEDNTPTLFLVESSPGSLIMSAWPLVVARLSGARFVPQDGLLPVLEPGNDYVIEPGEVRSTHDKYPARATRDSGTESIRLVLDAELHRRLIGRRFRVHVPRVRVYETVVRSSRPQAGIPPWALLWKPSLPSESLEGQPAWLWWWLGWLDVRPATVRTNPRVREAFQDLEDEQGRTRFNPLWIKGWYADFYTRFSRRVGLAMLEESRANMEATLRSMASDPQRWTHRLGTLIGWAAPSARTLLDVAHLPELERRLAMAKAGIVPEHGTADDDVAELERRIDTARAVSPPGSYWERTQGTGEGGTVSPDELAHVEALRVAQDIEPLLVLLRMENGTDVRTIEEAIAETAGRGPQYAFDHVREQLQKLLRWTEVARIDLLTSPGAALKLRPFQEEAQLELQTWLATNTLLSQVVAELTGEEVMKWLALGGVVLGLGIVFPPVVAALAGAAVGLLAAGESIANLAWISRFTRVRLAQRGFSPVTTVEDADEAAQQAILDVGLALLDLYGVGAAVKGLGAARASARGALAQTAEGALLRSVERQLARWRHVQLWPDDVVSELRRLVVAEARNFRMPEAIAVIDTLLADVQVQLLRRLEGHAEAIPRRLRAALDAGLPAEEISAWIAREVRTPSSVLEQLMRDEDFLRQAVATASGRQLSGAGRQPVIQDLLTRSFERQFGPWRNRQLWPEHTLLELRRRILAEGRHLGAPEGKSIDTLLADVQEQVLGQVESHAKDVPRRLREALDAGLPPEDIGTWISREVETPEAIIDRLIHDDRFMRQVIEAAMARARRALIAMAEAALRRSLDRQLLLWHRVDLWPGTLLTELRGRVIAQAQNLGRLEVVSVIDGLLVDVQVQFVTHLEAQAELTIRRLRAALDSGLPVDQIDAWITREVRSPGSIVEQLMRDDALVRKSVSAAMSRQTKGAFLRPTVGRLLSAPTAQEVELIRRELGALATAIAPDRIHRLAIAADVPTSEITKRLRPLLSRSSAPDALLRDLEGLLIGRSDAIAVLRALEDARAPALLPLLRRDLLDVPLGGGPDELFAALQRPSALGDPVVAFAERDTSGTLRLVRELRAADATRFERWSGAADGWTEITVPPPHIRSLDDPTWVSRVGKETNARLIETVTSTISASPGGKDLLELLVRQPGRVPDGILLGLWHWSSTYPTEIDTAVQAMTRFLERGGSGEFLAELLITLDRRKVNRRAYVRDFVRVMGTLDGRQVKGVNVVFREMRGGRDGAERVTNLVANLAPEEAPDVLNRLADLADVEGLHGPINYLTREPVHGSGRTSQNVNRAALGQLAAVRELLAEFPGRRIEFEAPGFNAAGALNRQVDVRLASRAFGITELDVELKMISDVHWIKEGGAQKQFAVDLVRSLERNGGDMSLRDIRWLIDEREFAANGVTVEELRNTFREEFGRAIDRDELSAYAVRKFGEGAVSERKTFLDELRRRVELQFDVIVRLF